MVKTSSHVVLDDVNGALVGVKPAARRMQGRGTGELRAQLGGGEGVSSYVRVHELGRRRSGSRQVDDY